MGALGKLGFAAAVAAFTAAAIASCGGKLAGTDDGGGAPPLGGDAIAPRPPPPPPPPPKPQPDRYVPGTCPIPFDVSGFVPPPFVPPTPAISACDLQQVQDLWSACFDPQTATALKCQAFTIANAACEACVLTPREDATWGPLVVGAGIADLNVAGCIALQGDKTCAVAAQQQEACERAACEEQCPVVDLESYQEYMKCAQTAEAQGCKKWTDVVLAVCTSPAAKVCGVAKQDFKAGYFAFVPMFCGAGG